MSGRPFATLKFRLLLFVCILMLPTLLVAVVSIRIGRVSAGNQAERYALSIAQSLARQFSSEARGAQRLLLMLAQLPAVRHQQGEEVSRILADLQAYTPEYTNFLCLRPDGRVWASTSPQALGINFADRDWLKKTLQSKDLVVSPVLQGRVSGEDTLVFAQPLLSPEGSVESALAVGLKFAWLRELIQKIPHPDETSFVLSDAEGLILVQDPGGQGLAGTSRVEIPMLQDMLARREGTTQNAGFDGIERIVGFTSFAIGGQELFFHAGIPVSAAYAESQRFLVYSLVFLGAFMSVALLAAWFGGKGLLIRPLSQLSSSLEAVAKGDLSVRSVLASSPDEIGQIAQAFNLMAASLKQREEARASEESLRRGAEESYRQLFTTMTEGFALMEVVLDEKGVPFDSRFIEVNPAFERLTGLSWGTLLGRTVREAPLEIDPQWLQAYGAVVRTGEPVEFDSHDEKRDRYFHVVCFSPARGKFATLLSDITSRKQGEKRVQMQLRWSQILNATTKAISQRNNIESILRIVLNHLEESLPVLLAAVFSREPGTQRGRVQALSSHGREIASPYGLSEGAEIPSASGFIDGLKPNQVNLLPIATVEAAISSPALVRGLSILGQKGVRSAAIIPLSLEGERFATLVLFLKGIESFDEYQESFLNGLTEELVLAVQNRRLYERLESSFQELQRAQKTLLEQERLNAMGQMASGVAHDINNTLAPIILYTESLIEREPALSAQGRKFLEIVLEAARDIEQTTSRLRKFYRKVDESEPRQRVEVSALFDEVVELTRPRWQDIPQQRGARISIEKQVAENTPALVGLASEFREMLTNLILNAVDAMPDGGTLTLRGFPRDERILLEVLDTGTGMSEEVRRHCLEPFYTTKGEQGTGMGLSVVFGILSRHRGDIQIESEPGKGTCVRLLLPVRSLKPVRERRAASVGSLPSLRLLCIDDDPNVRTALKTILELDGHLVETADGGRKGIEVFNRERERGSLFHAVLTDLGMPDLDGWHVAREIKGVSPETPVILLSGWHAAANPGSDRSPSVDLILGKPPKIQELREGLRRLVQPPPAPSSGEA